MNQADAISLEENSANCSPLENAESENVMNEDATTDPTQQEANDPKSEERAENNDDTDHKLAEDLDNLLNESASNISSHSTAHVETEESSTLGCTTLVLQDILARAETTFVHPEMDSTIEEKRRSSSLTRLPSISNDIIDMLIHIDNENYSKKDEKPPKTDGVQGNTTYISSSSPSTTAVRPSMDPVESMNNQFDAVSDDTLDIHIALQSRQPTHAQRHEEEMVNLDEINPTTNFVYFPMETLMKLSDLYRARVVNGNNPDDMVILMNISTVS